MMKKMLSTVVTLLTLLSLVFALPVSAADIDSGVFVRDGVVCERSNIGGAIAKHRDVSRSSYKLDAPSQKSYVDVEKLPVEKQTFYHIDFTGSKTGSFVEEVQEIQRIRKERFTKGKRKVLVTEITITTKTATEYNIVDVVPLDPSQFPEGYLQATFSSR